jgi:putative transcriptional regulator
MARTRKTLEQIKASKPKLDHAKLAATTEDDIRRYMIEDGFDPDVEIKDYQVVYPPHVVRKQLGMTQEEFAKALHIPVATLRNWEQGRVAPDPAARALLTIVARIPQAALKALAA